MKLSSVYVRATLNKTINVLWRSILLCKLESYPFLNYFQGDPWRIYSTKAFAFWNVESAVMP